MMRAYELKEHTPAGFVASVIRNEYVNFNGLSAYLRKGKMAIDGEIKNTIQLANLTNPKRPTNMEIDPNPKSTGKFSALMAELEALAKENGYDGVYVESVLNDFLPDVLERYGYSQVNTNTGTKNYWKNVV